jgi:hypothetical protein
VQGCMLCALSTSIPFTTVCAYVPRKWKIESNHQFTV